MRVLAWPAISDNPYIKGLYERIREQDPQVQVEGFSPTRSWRRRADVVHVHWPEAAVGSPSKRHAVTKAIAVLASLRVLKLRGAKVIWTCHNLRAHDPVHPRLEALVRRLFEPMVDGVIHLTAESKAALEGAGRLVDVPAMVVPHGYNEVVGLDPIDGAMARSQLGLPSDDPVLAFVGMIRPYKNVPQLIRAFAATNEPAHLLVAGQPNDDSVRAEVHAAAAGVDRLLLDDRWLSDDELVTRISACDAVVLPYRDVHNSGVAIMAVGLARPVALRPVGSMAGFAASVGEEWVYPLTDTMSGELLDDVIRWAKGDRHGRPSLVDFDPVEAAVRTIDFYRSLTGGLNLAS